MSSLKLTENCFPIIDISYLISNYLDTSLDRFETDPQILVLANNFKDGFTNWGFIYLTGHGISEEMINASFEISKQFFTLEKRLKENFLRGMSNDPNWGYVPFQVETFEKERPFDLKECFNFQLQTTKEDQINTVLPNFMETGIIFYNACSKLTLLLLRMITLLLPTNNQNFLPSQHLSIGNTKLNSTTLRLLYYPPVESEDVLNHQLRCGEHSDYGTITLLFQDEAGGLQVKSPTGEYIDAKPIPGTIVINSADMLKIWSAGTFPSTRHRVVVPNNCKTPRQSLAFFVHPDSDITVSCLDGSGRFPSVNPFEYLMKKFSDTY